MKTHLRGLVWLSLVACGGGGGGGGDDVDEPDAGTSSSRCEDPFGEVTVLADAVDPYGVAVDETTVFWAEQGEGVTGAGGLAAVAIGGGSASTLATGNVYELALDPTDVYFGASDGMYRIAKTGGAPIELSSQPGDGVAVDATDVYFGTTSLMRVPRAGGTPVMIAAERPRRIALDETEVYFTTSSGTLARVPKAGGTPAVLATDVTRAVAIDGDHVYYVKSGFTDGGVHRMPKAGGAEERLSPASEALEVTAMVVDDECVYWVTRDGGSVTRRPKTPGEWYASRAIGRGLVFGLAVDADAVYWGTVPYAGEAPGEIQRASKY